MKKTIIMICILAIAIAGCTQLDQTRQPYSDVLEMYLPQHLSEFAGDGNYYHHYKEMLREDTAEEARLIIDGEIKNTAMTSDRSKRFFKVEHVVDHESWRQYVDSSLFNDSQWETLDVLKLPLALDATWTFRAKSYDDSQTEWVTATIVDIADNGAVTVEYTTKSGKYEKRVLEKGKGTTSFIRKISYKSVTTYTGYHVMQIDDDIQSPLVDISIPKEIKKTIEDFYTSWSAKDMEALAEIVLEGSLAADKLLLIDWEKVDNMTLIDYKAVQMDMTSDGVVIYIVESYHTAKETEFINAVKYTFVYHDGRYKMIDFEPAEATLF